MALSNSRDFLLTRDDIIESALAKLGAIALGQSPSSSQVTRAAKALNSIVKTLQNNGTYLWEATTGNTTIVPGQLTPYDLGTTIIGIEHLFIRRGTETTDTPVGVLTRQEFMGLLDKSRTGKPTHIFPELTLAGFQFTVWPVGETGQTDVLYYTQYRKLQDFDVAGDDIPFPINWSQALIYLLAFDLSAEYGIPIAERQLLLRLGEGYKAEAVSNSRESGGVFFSISK